MRCMCFWFRCKCEECCYCTVGREIHTELVTVQWRRFSVPVPHAANAQKTPAEAENGLQTPIARRRRRITLRFCEAMMRLFSSCCIFAKIIDLAVVHHPISAARAFRICLCPRVEMLRIQSCSVTKSHALRKSVAPTVVRRRVSKAAVMGTRSRVVSRLCPPHSVIPHMFIQDRFPSRWSSTTAHFGVNAATRSLLLSCAAYRIEETSPGGKLTPYPSMSQWLRAGPMSCSRFALTLPQCIYILSATSS